MLIRFHHATGLTTICISETENKIWTSICEEEGESLSQTLSWLWKQTTAEERQSDNFTQFVRDNFLIRIHTERWFG